MSHKHADLTCPSCGHVLNASTSVNCDSIAPKSGNLTVCLYCASPLEVNADLTLRVMNEDEVKKLPLVTRIDLIEAMVMVKLYGKVK